MLLKFWAILSMCLLLSSTFEIRKLEQIRIHKISVQQPKQMLFIGPIELIRHGE